MTHILAVRQEQEGLTGKKWWDLKTAGSNSMPWLQARYEVLKLPPLTFIWRDKQSSNDFRRTTGTCIATEAPRRKAIKQSTSLHCSVFLCVSFYAYSQSTLFWLTHTFPIFARFFAFLFWRTPSCWLLRSSTSQHESDHCLHIPAFFSAWLLNIESLVLFSADYNSDNWIELMRHT